MATLPHAFRDDIPCWDCIWEQRGSPGNANWRVQKKGAAVDSAAVKEGVRLQQKDLVVMLVDRVTGPEETAGGSLQPASPLYKAN